ncbi:MAG: sulfatase-like hydrolase/transferase [Gallionellaceae bacterium]|nr:sulfatase-like hydrolase/transferase [Gallionellaceae bacterium]
MTKNSLMYERLRRWRSAIPFFPLLILLIILSIFNVTRLSLAVYAGLDLVELSLWPGIAIKGLWFDGAVIAVLIAAVCLYEAALPNRWRASRWHGVLRLIWLWGAIALLLFGAVAEITFWIEFSTRFNFIAVDYLLYTHEVIGNIRESYPVGWILSAIGLLAGVSVWLLRGSVRTIDTTPVTRQGRIGLLASALLLPALSLGLSNVDQMQGLGNAYADELSGNGLFTLIAAMRRNELDYDKFYQTMPQNEADAVLGQLGVQRPPLAGGAAPPQHEANNPVPFTKRPRNIVLISVESLSASFMGAYGASTGLTPQLDQLARDGLKFEQVYATGTRTVRGLEALSLGTPPVPGQAIVRRPNNEHLSTIGELLDKDFATFFFYGGYGYFDNMNAYYSANDYRVVDRTDFPKESVMFENVWGVADEALFNNALTVLDREAQQGKPFFAQIMTTSNHRPYTYPAGRIDIPSPGGRDGGVKYTDYAIGKFVQDAKAKPWFNDTLFVIVADHCAAVAGKSRLPLQNYHIPLIFYAPALLKPGAYAPMVSQIDIAPTLMDVLGHPGRELFFGRSIFEPGENPQRVFISNYQELGYFRHGILTVLSPKRGVASFKIDPVSFGATAIALDAQGSREAIAYYQTASRAFKSGALRAPDHR